jgi:phosphoglycerol transferase MdoB-like AlkP superfamily enzyme
LRAERALYFSGVWDLTGISPTADCEYLALNSLHPLPDAAVPFRYGGNHFVALPRVFSGAGYDTAALHAFDRGFWNRARVYPSYGFTHTYFDRELGSGQRYGWGLSDKTFFSRALERIDRLRRPFLAYLVTLTSHHPYGYLPKQERRIDTNGLPGILADYVASMRYVDEALLDLFAALGSRPDAANTVVAVYGDHESRISLDPKEEAATRATLSLRTHKLADLARRSFEIRRVPFFVVLPGSNQARSFDGIGGQIDLGPTLLHLFGVEKPRSMLGRPLFQAGGRAVRYDGAAVDPAHVRFPDGSCKNHDGALLATGDCADLARRADEEIQMSWAITRLDLAGRLSEPRPAPAR